jgi:hypothetical protein
LHDVAVKRFTESFCNTSAKCGARCRRCSEPCRREPATYATPSAVVGDELTPLRPARSVRMRPMPVLHPERRSATPSTKRTNHRSEPETDPGSWLPCGTSRSAPSAWPDAPA